MKILIDPGHMEGYNPGAVKGYYEGNQVWLLAGFLIAELRNRGFTVDCTKSSINDYPRTSAGKDFIYGRGRMAKGYDLFLSIHSNACNTESVDRPVIIHQLDGSGKALGEKLGEVIRRTMGTSQNCQLYTRASSSGEEWYGVLRGAKSVGVTGLILEHSFHTNIRACTWLLQEENLRTLAKAEADCIGEFYGVSAPTSESTAKAETTPSVTAGGEEEFDLSTLGNVKYGSTGTVVKNLQLLLNARGYSCGTADGVAGNKTVAGIKRFQSVSGLTADGICGVKTWTKLMKG